MAITTGVSSQSDAQARLQMWLDCEEAISSGQSYSIADRSLTRADLPNVRESITYWQRQVQAFAAKAAGAASAGVRVATWKG